MTCVACVWSIRAVWHLKRCMALISQTPSPLHLPFISLFEGSNWIVLCVAVFQLFQHMLHSTQSCWCVWEPQTVGSTLSLLAMPRSITAHIHGQCIFPDTTIRKYKKIKLNKEWHRCYLFMTKIVRFFFFDTGNRTLIIIVTLNY